MSFFTDKTKLFARAVFISLFILVGLFASPQQAQAVWDGNLYQPGTTLNPECTPTQTSCNIVPPVSQSGDQSLSGTLTLTPTTAAGLSLAPFGTAAGNTSELRLFELAANGSNFVAFKSVDNLTGNVIWTLPNADGTTGQVLSTDGSGALSWATATSSQWITSGSAIYYNAGNVGIGTNAPTANLSFGASAATINNAATNGALTISSNGTGNITLVPGASGIVLIGNNTNQGVFIGSGSFQINTSPQIISMGQILPGAPIIREGLRFLEPSYINGVSTTGNNYVGFQSPGVDLATTTVWSLPVGDGTSGQVLSTDGVGALSWLSTLTSMNGFAQNGNSFGGLATLGTNDNNALALETNGAERLRIDANGNIGIGTNTPTAKLEISPSGTAGVTWATKTAPTIGYKSVAFGNGIYVAVADTDSVATSPDSITWTQRSIPTASIWRGVTYANGLFVAVGSISGTGTVMTSPDGITWTSRTPAANNNWRSIAYGNNIFVAVASSGTGNRVMTSPDGITWTSRTSASDDLWYGVTYGNNLFVAVSYLGSTYRVMTSPDGIAWTGRTASSSPWNSVAYGGGLFVAVSEGGAASVITSPDGITWTDRTVAANNNWKSVTYGNGLFVAVSYSGTGNRVMTSPDGITWTSRTSAADNNWQGVTFGNNLFVAVADSGTNRIMTSSGASPTAILANGGISVAGSVVPTSNIAYDLGSATNRWRDLYLSGATLYIGDQTLSNQSGSLTWSGTSIAAAPSATSTSELKLSELSGNGVNFTGFKSPDALAANVLYTLPAADGASGQMLSTNASGVLSWASANLGKSSTVHHTGATALAITPTHNNAEIHVENTGGFTIDGTAFTTDTFGATIVNTGGVSVNLTPSNFAGAFLRDGTADSGFTTLTIGQDEAYSLTVTDNSGAKFLNVVKLGGGTANAFAQNGNAFNALATLGTTDNNALRFIASSTEAMRILANGNVGIGTNTPSSKLTVQGVAGNTVANPNLNSGNGVVTTDGSDTVITYTTVGASTFTPPTGVTSVQILAVAGGGGGAGFRSSAGGAGGGAGGYISSSTVSVSPSASVAITVGAGGAGGAASAGGGSGAGDATTDGINGSNSIFGTIITAVGGGGAGGRDRNGKNGGSGGGAGIAGTAGTPGTGEVGQGNAGGNNSVAANYGGGGGGGAGAVGGNGSTTAGGNGGAGLDNTITGSSVGYAGGGGAAMHGTTAGAGTGTHGGGNVGSSGTANTGGGGGGALQSGGNGGNGGSGIVIVRFATVEATTLANQALLRVTNTGTDASSTIAFFETGANQGCIIAGQTGLSCSSDIRLKKNVETMNSALGNVLALRPVTFDWNSEADGAGSHIGFIAQDVEKIFPGLVVTDPNGKKALAYDRFAPILVKSVQELASEQKFITSRLDQTEAAQALSTVSPSQLEKLVISGALTVGNLEVLGESIFKNIATFTADANFEKAVVFAGDVTFKGRALFEDRDMAGFAKIALGQDRVEVKYDKEYPQTPVVQTSLASVELSEVAYEVNILIEVCSKDESREVCEEKATKDALSFNRGHAVVSSTTKGFTILLENPALYDLTFNWIAIPVKNARTQINEVAPSPSPSATPTALPSPTPSPTPDTALEEDGGVNDENEISPAN